MVVKITCVDQMISKITHVDWWVVRITPIVVDGKDYPLLMGWLNCKDSKYISVGVKDYPY